MSRNLRHSILRQIAKTVQDGDHCSMEKIAAALTLSFKNNQYSFELPIKTETYDLKDNVDKIVSNDLNRKIFDSVNVQEKFLLYKISRDNYMKSVLNCNCLGIEPPTLLEKPKNIIVEFSSPNIAKPFHLGHFRSTIIGNSLANINKFMGNNVKRINYLGDWGKQFSLIQIGTVLENITEADIKKNAVQTLYRAYVAANKKLEEDPSIDEQAQDAFRRLEGEDSDTFRDWEKYKTYTVESLSKTYERLGITFDEYHWESMYRASQIQDVLALMKHKNLLSNDEHNRTVIHLDDNSIVPLQRSDNTTLYILRDIAAAIDRYQKNQFDLMYYVVDGTQTKHFNNITGILEKMEMPWVDRVQLISFGRIVGMSTRKGTSISIEDILNELQAIMKEGQLNSPTTKISLEEMDSVADILAVTGLIIYDLQQRRERNYSFQMKDVIQVANEGAGRKLQYTHCRLSSLENQEFAKVIKECDPSYLKESEIDKLLFMIGKFDEVIIKSYTNSQPCILAGYTLRLCSQLGTLFGKLPLKDQPADVANNRLLVFHVGRLVLAQSMKILGITPLSRM